MAYEETETTKLYYSMGEVSKMFNVNPSLIRFWEKEFDIIQPKKNKKGNRLFTAQDIENFRNIYTLVKQKGYTLQGAKSTLKKDSQLALDDDKALLVRRLEKIKQDLFLLRDKI